MCIRGRIYPRSYATTPWRPSWYHQLPVLLWGCWSLVRFLPPLWFGGRRLSSKNKKVPGRCWCALTPAPRCVRLTRAPHASAELVRTPLAHARPPVASREPQRLPVPHIRPPGAHHRCLCHNQSPFRSIVSCLHTPLPPPLRVPQVRLRAEREAAEWRFFWLSFFAGMVITSVFV